MAKQRPQPHYCAVPGCRRYALRGRRVCYSHRRLDPDEHDPRDGGYDMPSLAYCKALAIAIMWQALVDLPMPDAYAFLSDPAAREFIDGILDIHPDELDAIIQQVETGELDFSRFRTTISRPHAPSGDHWHALHPRHADQIRTWHRRLGHRST
jgi:hypothetical protein